jgi:MarR family 2-MHQ and catechol resistance regulon transcriptional repressor
METASHIRLILWKAEKAVGKVDKASIVETGLQLSEFAILEVLLHKGALPIQIIGAKVLLTSGSMTAAVNRLEKKGLVQRIPDPTDGRSFQIHLTEKGLHLIQHAYAQHENKLEKMVTVLNEKERSELVHLLKKIGYQAERMLSEE